MKTINFRNGHHLDVNTMDYIQSAYNGPISALAKGSAVNDYIVSGLDVSYDNNNNMTVSNGFVVIGGVMMEFRTATINILTETEKLYVVKKTEVAKNLNASGLNLDTFTTDYATLGENEVGAVAFSLLDKYRMHHFITTPYQSGDITTDYVVSSLDDAQLFGALSVATAKPKYMCKNNYVALQGVFCIHDAGSIDITLGTLPIQLGTAVSNIKCTIYTNKSTGESIQVNGLAYINANGGIKLMSDYVGAHNAVVFDGTPYMVVK